MNSIPRAERRATEVALDVAMACLQRVRALYGEQLAAVDTELTRAVWDGLAPATNAAAHLLDAGGKRIRPLTAILSAECFDAPDQVLVRNIAVVAELVHLATLLHDDVIDEGQERRGRPTSRRLWGNAVSVLSGDMLLTLAIERTSTFFPKSILSDLFATLRRLVQGEILQLASRETLAIDEADYFRVVRDKTASLFEWAARSGAVCGGASPDASRALGEFGAEIGFAFQLIDDALDYVGDPEEAGKSLLADLAQGKLTLPLIRAIEAAPALRADVDAIRSGDQAAALRVADIVRSSGVCEGVRALAGQHSERALVPLRMLPPSAARDLLGDIARDLSARIA